MLQDEKLHSLLNMVPAILPPEKVQEIRIAFTSEQDAVGQTVFLPKLTILAKD